MKTPPVLYDGNFYMTFLVTSTHVEILRLDVSRVFENSEIILILFAKVQPKEHLEFGSQPRSFLTFLIFFSLNYYLLSFFLNMNLNILRRFKNLVPRYKKISKTENTIMTIQKIWRKIYHKDFFDNNLCFCSSSTSNWLFKYPTIYVKVCKIILRI